MKKILGYLLLIVGIITLLVQLEYFPSYEVMIDLLLVYWPIFLVVAGYSLILSKSNRKSRR